jgi:hypothetical protein
MKSHAGFSVVELRPEATMILKAVLDLNPRGLQSIMESDTKLTSARFFHSPLASEGARWCAPDRVR